MVGCASAQPNNHMALLAVSHLELTKTDNKGNIPDTMSWSSKEGHLQWVVSTVAQLVTSQFQGGGSHAGKLISSCEL